MSNHFKIIVPFYNVEKWIKFCIRSLKAQDYKNFQCVLVDDCSTDGTSSIVRSEILNDERFTFIENKSNVGALENIYKSINLANPDDEDIIVTLDGDDWLANANVLSLINKYYTTSDCWLTYGSHVLYPSGQRSKFCTGPVPSSVIRDRTFRSMPWMTSALRTFKYKLWKNIDEQDLKNKNGNFYEAAWDLAFMFPMLEMAGNRIQFVKELVYVYNLHDNNDHVVPEKRQKQLMYESEIRRKQRYGRLSQIHSKYDDRIVVDNPLQLLTPLRFDVPAKVLYARHRAKGVEGIFAKKVYEHHLDVWGGFTEKSPAKNGVSDFYEAYHSVLDNMRDNGFDEDISCIPITNNGLLLNGAHRTAAAICYNKPVICEKSTLDKGQVLCSADYFINKRDIVPNGMDSKIADAIALEYVNLKDDIFVASLYEHTQLFQNQINDILIKNNIHVVYSKQISLSETGKLNYVISAYSGEAWIRGGSNGYPGAQEQAKLNFSKGNKVNVLILECSDIKNIISAKEQIRELVGVGKPSIHITDTKQEAWNNATIALHAPTLEFINSSCVGSFNDMKIRKLVEETRQIIERSNLELEDVCVVGSAPLALYGGRDCRDFDLLHLQTDTHLACTDRVASHMDYARYYQDAPHRIIYDPDKHIYAHGMKFLSIRGMIGMKLARGEEKDFRDIAEAKKFITNDSKNIIILAAGPAKPGRNRHLELYGGQPLISKLLSECSIEGTNTYVVVDKNNHELKSHLKEEHPDVGLLFPEDAKIISTFRAALSVEGDCVMVTGDLINVRQVDIERFIVSDYKSATCHYALPWGPHIRSASGGLLRRADVGDCISMISQEHKEEFLSSKNNQKARELFNHFYPKGNQHDKMNEYWYNDMGTFTSFAFFESLWSNPGLNCDSGKGLITFSHKIYEDND